MAAPTHIPIVRNLLLSTNPFTLGRYPQRVAPAHVANGIVAAAIGVSDQGALVRTFIAEDAEVPEELTFASPPEWPGTKEQLVALRRSLGASFNPDRRSWKDVGSLAPVHAGFATRDASDDRVGPLLWALLESADADLGKRLEAFLRPVGPRDPVSRAALTLVKDASVEGNRHEAVPDTTWFGEKGSQSGRALALELASFIGRLIQPYDDGRRLMALQHLSRGLFFAAFLALLRGPRLSVIASAETPLHADAPILLWGDVPPGHGYHPIVTASQRSFQNLVKQHRDSLIDALTRGLGAQELPSALPEAHALREAAKSLLAKAGLDATAQSRAIAKLENEAGAKASGGMGGAGDWAEEVIESAYSLNFVASGLRTMGVKIGVIGPAGGQGAPRFICETPLLGTLVEGICPVGESMSFDEFIDALRERLGIVVGPGSRDEVVVETQLWEAVGTGRKLLAENQEAFRRRLIRTGLAREYSDRHTEVFNYE